MQHLLLGLPSTSRELGGCFDLHAELCLALKFRPHVASMILKPRDNMFAVSSAGDLSRSCPFLRSAVDVKAELQQLFDCGEIA
jgi:hypothetical protein